MMERGGKGLQHIPRSHDHSIPCPTYIYLECLDTYVADIRLRLASESAYTILRVLPTPILTPSPVTPTRIG